MDMNENNAYQEALDYLYSFIDYSRSRQENLAPENFDLARMFALMTFLGEPHEAYQSIHVAGTKGKGSVSSFCAAVLHAAGYQVGLYTSPHMQDFTERIQVGMQQIPAEDLAALIEEIKPHVAAVPGTTTFEIMTALAFMYFARKQVDVAVFEVGLGGRLDATNVVTPLVSVITSLSYEHTSILGETLAEIAGEKAGIIKPGVPVVVAPQQEEALLVIEQIAVDRESAIIQVGEDYKFKPITRSLDKQTIQVWAANKSIEQSIELEIGMLGGHQVENAAVAYAALQVLRDKGIQINTRAMLAGFAQNKWPGRFEILSRDPVLVVDGAHNRESANKLRLAMDEYFSEAPLVLVFGCSVDKDLAGMFDELLPRAQKVIATRSLHPRAMEPQLIIEQALPFGKPVIMAPFIEEALEEAQKMVEPDGIIMITGSVFMAGAGRAAWLERQSVVQKA